MKNKKILLIAGGMMALAAIGFVAIKRSRSTPLTGYYKAFEEDKGRRLWLKPNGTFATYGLYSDGLRAGASGTYDVEDNKINFHLAGQTYQGHFSQEQATFTESGTFSSFSTMVVYTGIVSDEVRMREVKYIRITESKDTSGE